MIVFIENGNQQIRFAKKFNNTLDDYWKIEDDKYFNFVEDLENRYNSTLDFYGEGDEVGYCVLDVDGGKEPDRETVEKIFNDFASFIEQNI